jgi:hypothetical protein
MEEDLSMNQWWVEIGGYGGSIVVEGPKMKKPEGKDALTLRTSSVG